MANDRNCCTSTSRSYPELNNQEYKWKFGRMKRSSLTLEIEGIGIWYLLAHVILDIGALLPE
jgi:hypothetical protein